MPVPIILNDDHEVLGTEFCSGYVDTFGKWNTGFYCPQVDVAEASYCCGTQTFKYCCSGKELGLERKTDEPDEQMQVLSTFYASENF
ncbi:hypothetical protein QYM36_001434 [Artemia franciscana]|uniref:Shisa N-terminal domain-containing protein n=1 Tax=Artemia franciscana TaxID=6661 RepID=A0AA88LFN8_ARTSF|nr:hypothetical protein QYM36_001434 [Artemia franciscana]KAK2724979.1 hypothetical protein QYM36_001434 [Artemia franciscana]